MISLPIQNLDFIIRTMEVQWKNNSHIHKITYRQELNFLQETTGYRYQSILRPFVEPVDAGAVCDGRELSAPNSEGGSNRREAEHHL